MNKPASGAPFTAIGAVVTLVGIIGVVITGLGVTHNINADSTPLLSLIIGIVSATIPALLATLKNEQIHNDMKNGLISGKVKQGLNDAISDIRDETTTDKVNGNG